MHEGLAASCVGPSVSLDSHTRGTESNSGARTPVGHVAKRRASRPPSGHRPESAMRGRRAVNYRAVSVIPISNAQIRAERSGPERTARMSAPGERCSPGAPCRVPAVPFRSLRGPAPLGRRRLGGGRSSRPAGASWRLAVLSSWPRPWWLAGGFARCHVASPPGVGRPHSRLPAAHRSCRGCRSAAGWSSDLDRSAGLGASRPRAPGGPGGPDAVPLPGRERCAAHRACARAGLRRSRHCALVLGLGRWRPGFPAATSPTIWSSRRACSKDGDLRIENNHPARDYARYAAASWRRTSCGGARRGRSTRFTRPACPCSWRRCLRCSDTGGSERPSCCWMRHRRALLAGRLARPATRAAPGSPGRPSSAGVTLLAQRRDDFSGRPGGAWRWPRRRPRGSHRTWDRETPALGRWRCRRSWPCCPSLHTRLVALSPGLGRAVTAALLAVERLAPRRDRRRRVQCSWRCRRRGLWCGSGYFEVLYGTPNPAAPYGRTPGRGWRMYPGAWLACSSTRSSACSHIRRSCCWAWRHGFGWRNDAQRWMWPLPAVGHYLGAVSTYWMWWAGVAGDAGAACASAILPRSRRRWRGRVAAGARRRARRDASCLLAVSLAITAIGASGSTVAPWPGITTMRTRPG